jgi:hypothetical protein
MKSEFSNITMIKILDGSDVGVYPKGTMPPSVSYSSKAHDLFNLEIKGGNTYCQALRYIGQTEDHYDKNAGIKYWDPVLEAVETLQAEHPDPDEIIYVLLDWDRTITTFEGYYPVEDLISKIEEKNTTSDSKFPIDRKQLYEDQLRYLLGGWTSLSRARRCLKILATEYPNVHVWILTNNGSCDDPRRPDDRSFRNMVAALSLHINRVVGAAWLYAGNKTRALTSELVKSRSEGGVTGGVTGGGNSSASSSGGSRKTRKRHGPGHSRTRGRYHLRKSKTRTKKKRAARVLNPIRR